MIQVRFQAMHYTLITAEYVLPYCAVITREHDKIECLGCQNSAKCAQVRAFRRMDNQLVNLFFPFTNVPALDFRISVIYTHILKFCKGQNIFKKEFFLNHSMGVRHNSMGAP